MACVRGKYSLCSEYLSLLIDTILAAAGAQEESQADGNGLRAEEAQPPEYTDVGLTDGVESWSGQERQLWPGENQPWYGQDQQGWYGQDTFGPMAPQDYDVANGQFYQPQEEQPYWAQQPQEQVNGDGWYSPDSNGQMYAPDLNGQAILPDQNGQAFLPDQNGQAFLPDLYGEPSLSDFNSQPFMPDQNGEPYMPDQNGQPYFSDQNGELFMPAMSEEPQESDAGLVADPGPYSNGWYTPMASVAPGMPEDWNGGFEYPNQWYNVDPFGPVPSYDQVSHISHSASKSMNCPSNINNVLLCLPSRIRVITCTSIITTTATAAPTWTTATTITSFPSARRASAYGAARLI